MNSGAGFANAFIFKKITDDHITEIETYIREDALNVHSAKLSESLGEFDAENEFEVLLGDDEMIDIFGEKYASMPAKFKLQPGEIMLIRELVKHVKKLVDNGGENMGLNHFKERKRKMKPINVTSKQNRNEIENVSDPIDRTGKKSLAISETEMESQHSELKSKLFSLCLENMQAFKVHEQLIKQFNEHMIQLRWNDGVISGSIECILCKNDKENHSKKKKDSYSVRYFQSPGSSYWILSNYKKHLEKMHNLFSSSDLRSKKKHHNRLPKKTSNKTSDSKKSMSIEIVELPVFNSDDDVKEDTNLRVHSPAGSIHSNAMKSKNDNLTEMVTNTDIIVYSPAGSVSLEDDWLYTQLSNQIADMIGTTLESGDITEIMNFKIANDIKTITVSPILPDGNCLLGAICHQIYHDPIGSTAHRNKINELRKNVVKHILDPENYPSYEHSLKDRIYENKKKSSDAIGDMTQECKLFVRHGLSRDRYWCGYETIAAAAEMLDVNILVFNEEGDVYLPSSNVQTHSKTIALAYRLNNGRYNHYDSVCDIDSNVLYEIVQTVQAVQKNKPN